MIPVTQKPKQEQEMMQWRAMHQMMSNFEEKLLVFQVIFR